MAYWQYPSSVGSNVAAEQPLWLNFYTAPYSLVNYERTRGGVITRAQQHIALPLPKEPGFMVAHEFGESNNNPVAPILTAAGIANAGGGVKGTLNVLKRMMQPATFYWERMFATSTYRRFSNIAEYTMVSEGRKQYLFQYVLVPKNREDSLTIDGIVGTFRKCSYPAVADGLPERSYPQNLWCLQVSSGNQSTFQTDPLTNQWLGEPLVCVLDTIKVEKNDASDPVVRYLPDGGSSFTLLALKFTEFETGTYSPEMNRVLSKSEISVVYQDTSQGDLFTYPDQ
jgi:hypothetical protein